MKKKCFLFFVVCFYGSFFEVSLTIGLDDNYFREYQKVVSYLMDNNFKKNMPIEYLLTEKKVSKEDISHVITFFIKKAKSDLGQEDLYAPDLSDFRYYEAGYVNDILKSIYMLEKGKISNDFYLKEVFPDDYTQYLILHIKQSHPSYSVSMDEIKRKIVLDF